MKMRDCPKFQTCNAPLCILDEDWQLRRYSSEDACCCFLLESQKAGAEAIFKVAGREELYATAIAVAPAISARYTTIAKLLERAKSTGSRMARFQREPENG